MEKDTDNSGGVYSLRSKGSRSAQSELGGGYPEPARDRNTWFRSLIRPRPQTAPQAAKLLSFGGWVGNPVVRARNSGFEGCGAGQALPKQTKGGFSARSPWFGLAGALALLLWLREVHIALHAGPLPALSHGSKPAFSEGLPRFQFVGDTVAAP